MKGKLVDYLFIRNGKGRLTIDIEEDFRRKWEKLSGHDIEIKIKRYSDPRTLRANAYLWALITEISNRLRANKEDIYFDMLKDYGQGGMVSVQEQYAKQFERNTPYKELLGESELNGSTWRHYKFWVGSHEYDRHEFAILLDGVIHEAKNLDIEVKPRDEIEAMLNEWDRRAKD